MRCILVLSSLLVCALELPAQNQPGAEKKLVSFEEAARTNPIPDGGSLFIGSSTIEIWGKRFAPKGAEPIIFRGVGGTTYEFLLRNADRLLSFCKPKRIIIYSGDNDIGEGAGGEKSGETVASRARELVAKIETQHPDAKIYILAVKPSIKRAAAETAQACANAGIKKISEEKPSKVFFVDTRPILLGDDGKPNPLYFAPDGLHLNEQGYARWNELIAPILAD